MTDRYFLEHVLPNLTYESFNLEEHSARVYWEIDPEAISCLEISFGATVANGTFGSRGYAVYLLDKLPSFAPHIPWQGSVLTRPVVLTSSGDESNYYLCMLTLYSIDLTSDVQTTIRRFRQLADGVWRKDPALVAHMDDGHGQEKIVPLRQTLDELEVQLARREYSILEARA